MPAGVAPNAEHGFEVALPAKTAASLQQGKHAVEVHLVGSPGSEVPWALRGSPVCVCDGKACPCG